MNHEKYEEHMKNLPEDRPELPKFKLTLLAERQFFERIGCKFHEATKMALRPELSSEETDVDVYTSHIQREVSDTAYVIFVYTNKENVRVTKTQMIHNSPEVPFEQVMKDNKITVIA